MKQAVRAIVLKDDKLLVIHRDKFGHKYTILPGGSVGFGETLEQAISREMKEETGVEVENARLVFIEPVDDMYGTQQVFLAEYVSGEPTLSPESEEAKISAMGKNFYIPGWLPLSELPNTVFRSERLKEEILNGVKNGFPEKAEKLL